MEVVYEYAIISQELILKKILKYAP